MSFPYDILAIIFLLVNTHDIDHKFKLSHVCSTWRAAALSASSLWSRMTVATPLDASRLPLVLHRSASCPLDIELPWYDNYQPTIISCSDRAEAALALSNHCQRLQRLHLVYEGDESPGLRSILASGRDLPLLEDLNIQGSGFTLTVNAPRLRSLVLDNQQVGDWEGLLSPSLMRLEATNGVIQNSLNILHTFFRACPALEQVALHVDLDGFTDFPVSEVPALRSLVLHAVEGADIAAVLRSGFSKHVIWDISTCSLYGDIQDMCVELVCGLDPLVSFIVHNGLEIEVHDAAGRTRRVEASHEDLEWYGTEVWRELVQNASAHQTMKRIEFQACYWSGIADICDTYEPENESLEMYIELDSSDVMQTRYTTDGVQVEHHALRRINCPPLRKVTFHDSTLEGVRTIEVVLRLLESLDCAHPRVEVCIRDCGIGIEELSFLVERLYTLREEGEWVMCTQCSLLTAHE